MRDATRGVHGVRSLGWVLALFAASACGSDAAEQAPRLGRQTSALLSDDGGVLDAALSTFDGSTAGDRATGELESQPNPRAEGVEYIELGEPAFSSEEVPPVAPDGDANESVTDGGVPDAGLQREARRVRRLETQDVRPLVEQPDFELEIHTCANSAAPVATDKAYLTVQAGGEARGWELTTSRAANATARFAFLWTGASMDQLQAIKLELRGTSSWCVDRLALRWYGLNRSALNNPQELWSWTSSVAQPGTYPYLHGHPSNAQPITLDNNANTARTSFIRFALDTAAYRVATHASRCNESVQRRGFCVQTCTSPAAGATVATVAVKHDNLWDFLSVKPSEVDQPNDVATINTDNFCAIRNLQSIRLSALTFDPWSVCGTYFHAYAGVPLFLPNDPLAARSITPLAAGDNCAAGNGYIALWESGTDARTTSASTGTYTYTINRNIDTCTGANCVNARQGFVLALNNRVKACLAGTNPADSTCDGIDQDCDGVADDGWTSSSATNCVGECRTTARCVSGAVQCGAPVREVPGNGRNEDCDTRTDELPPLGTCTADAQCDESDVCQSGKCVAPYCTNGVQDIANGEAGIDCGGANCPACDGASGCENACRIGEPTTPDGQALLRFATGTFRRGSDATYEPRHGQVAYASPNTLRWIDVDGRRMALLEGGSSNQARHSQALNDYFWYIPSGSSVVVRPDAMQAPDGTSTAEVVTMGAPASRGPMQGVTFEGRSAISVYAAVPPGSTASRRATRAFAVGPSDVLVASGLWALDEVWQRVDFAVATATAGASLHFSHAPGWPVPDTAPLSGSDVGLWGVQVEALPFPTSYIPSTTGRAFRSADELVFDSVPNWFGSGLWQMEVLPEFSSGELIENWNHTLVSGTGARVALSNAGNGAAYLTTTFTTQRRTPPLRWARGTVLRLTFNNTARTITLEGAEGDPVTLSVSDMSFPPRVRIGGALGGTAEAYAAFTEPRRIATASATCAPDASCTCGNGTLDAGEQCDPGLTANCTGQCRTAAPEQCDEDIDCANGTGCEEGVASSFDLPADWKVCVPPICLVDDATNCGSVTSPCGRCECEPQCDGKQCGDDQSDGCGGTCGGLCDPLETGCEHNADCRGGSFCWIGQAWRFDTNAPVGANVCAPAECDDIDPRRIDCGTPNSACGRCDPGVPPCLRGALCRKDDAPACPNGQVMNQVGACVPTYDLPVTDDVPTVAIGALPGAFAVSNAGTAQYRIPLAVPPGRAGLQPGLALTYDSARGNSMVGVGWALEGLSQINVCPKSVAQDGYIDGTAALCVDGARLVPVSYDSTRGITEWRTEFDSFTKYETAGNFYAWEGQTPTLASFTAYTKDGLILTYGVSEEVGQDDDDDPARLRVTDPVKLEGERYLTYSAWALGSIRDRAGNEIRFRYSKLTSTLYSTARDVEMLPRWIGYNFARDAGHDAATAEIVFEYGDESNCSTSSANCVWRRRDRLEGFVLGQQRVYSRTLSAVRVYALGQEIRKYKLTPVVFGNGLITVDSVTECVADEVCRPATKFNYRAQAAQAFYELHPLFSIDRNSFVLDYDGDRYPDFAELFEAGRFRGFDIKENTARDTGVSGLSSYGFSHEGQQRPDPYGQRFVRDMDGDRAQDIVYLDLAGRVRVSSLHDNTQVFTLRYRGSDGREVGNQFANGNLALADINGDGRPDVVYCGNGSTYGDARHAMVHINKGDALSVAAPLEVHGRCEGAQIINDSSGREYVVWKNADSGKYEVFGETTEGNYTALQFPNWEDHVNGLLFTLDFNGDGLTDIANAVELSNQTTRIVYAPNQGNLKFGEPILIEQPTGAEAIAHADVDADGRDERIQIRDRRIEIVDVEDGADVRGLPGQVAQFYVADMDHDGTDDIVAQRPNSTQWVVYPGTPADGGLLEKITVPFSAQGVPNEYNIEYSFGEGDVYSGGAANLPNGVAPARRLPHPVVGTYASQKFWQKAGDPQVIEYRSATFQYGRGMRDRRTGTWLGFGERTVRRVGFGAVGDKTSNYTFEPRIFEERDDGPFYRRNPNLRGRGYVYRYHPFAGAPAEHESHTASSSGLGNPLTGGLDTVRVNVVDRRYELLRSDKGLPFINIVTETHTTSENGRPVETVTFETHRDAYGNVATARESHGDGQYSKSSYKYEHASDPERIRKWQIDLVHERSDTVVGTEGSLPYSHVETYGYRPDGLLHTITSEPGKVDEETITTYFRQDSWKNVTDVEVKAGAVSGTAPVPRMASWIYDKLGVHVETTQNAEGHTSTFQTGMGDGLPRYHQDPNHVVTRWNYDGFGRLKAQNRETERITTTFDYRTAGQDLTQIAITNGAWKVETTTKSIAANESFKTTSVYDPDGLLVREISPGFEPNTTVSQEYDYTRGLLTKLTRPHLDLHTSQGAVRIEYDNFGRRTKEWAPGIAQPRTTWYASKATVVKDFKGTHADSRWIARVDSPKQTASYYYTDALGNLVESIEGRTSTTYKYGAAGFLEEVKDTVGNVTRRTPDHLGRLLTMVDPDTGRESYTYNSFGELKTVAHNTDAPTTYVYDLLGRVVELQTRDGVTRHTYDRMTDPSTGVVRARVGALMRSVTQAVAGQTEEQSPGRGHIDDYIYDQDAIGQLRTIHRSVLLSESGPREEREEMDLGFEYDKWLRPDVVHYPGAAAFSVKYEYDAKGFLISAKNAHDPSEQFYELREVYQGYRPKQTKLAGTMTQDFTFSDLNGWVEDAKTTAGRFLVEVVHFGYGYDENGNVRHVRRFHDPLETQPKVYHYDELERLKSVTRGERGPEIEGFTYTDTGNLKTKSGTGTYHYGTWEENDDTAPQTLPHFARSVTDGDVEVAHFIPDAHGRVASRTGSLVPGGLQTFGYDAFGRLKSVHTGEARSLTEFEYSAGGDRVLLREDSGERLTTYFGSLYEHRRDDEQDVETFRVMVNGQAIAERTHTAGATATRYLHRNHLGSVEAITDEHGTVQDYRDHSAHGDRLDALGADESVLSFTGHRAESDLGLVDMLGRFYDPKFGRFLTPDPIVAMPWSGQSLNRYSYVLNNPATLVDPTGFTADRNPYTGEVQDPGGPGPGGGYVEGQPDGVDRPGDKLTPQEECDQLYNCQEGVFPSGTNSGSRPYPTATTGELRGSPVSTINGPLEGSGTSPSAWERGDYEEVMLNAADSGATQLAGYVDGILLGTGDTLRGWMGYEGLINTESSDYVVANLASIVSPTGVAGAVLRVGRAGVALARASSIANRWRAAATALNALHPAKGFKTFRSLKKFLGGNAAGHEWHHIVEQVGSNIATFGKQAIHNVANVVQIPISVHRKISAYYSSIRPFTEGKTVRVWLRGKSWDEQYEFGLQVLRDFGVIP